MSPANTSTKAKAIKLATKTTEESIEELRADMDRLTDRLRELAAKPTLNNSEKKEQQSLLTELEKLADSEKRLLLLKVIALDSSDNVKAALATVESVNKKLEETKKRVEEISKSIKEAGEFIKKVTNVLSQLTGILKFLV